MKRLEKFPVTVGFIGVLIGALLVGLFQYQLYSSQRKDVRIAKKEQVLEEAYRAYGRVGEIKFLQQERDFSGSDLNEAKIMLFEFEKERNATIGLYFSNLLAINKLIEVYYDEKTQNLIRDTFSPENNKEWWNIPNEQFNAITESMKRELELATK